MEIKLLGLTKIYFMFFIYTFNKNLFSLILIYQIKLKLLCKYISVSNYLTFIYFILSSLIQRKKIFYQIY